MTDDIPDSLAELLKLSQSELEERTEKLNRDIVAHGGPRSLSADEKIELILPYLEIISEGKDQEKVRRIAGNIIELLGWRDNFERMEG